MYRSTGVTWAARITRAAAVGAVLVAAGCGSIEVTVGDDSISADEVAERAEKALAPDVSGKPEITCESGINAEDRESTTCEMRVGGDPKTYEVEATLSIVDDRYSLNFRSDDYHSTSGTGAIFADEVARQAEQSLGKEVGFRPDVTCPDDLPGEVGATVRCVLRVEGDDTSYGVTAKVTKVDGSDYRLSFAVDEQPVNETN